MPAPYHKLSFLAEDALYTYFKTVLSANVYRMADAVATGEKLTAPYVAVIGERTAQEFPDAPVTDQAAGNRVVTLTVEIVTTIDPTTSGGVVTATARQGHANLVAEVEDMLFVSDFVTQLNAQGIEGVTVQHFTFGDSVLTTERHKYKTALEVALHVIAVV